MKIQKNINLYDYPRLSDKDFGWIRLSGPGLANCMFVAARAYINSQIYGTTFIAPTWCKISIGPWLRNEKDKRIYNRLFESIGVSGTKKLVLIIKSRVFKTSNIRIVSGLADYFVDLNGHYPLVKDYFEKIVREETISNVSEAELSNTIAVHVRLGDYNPEYRIDIDWYKGIIENIVIENKNQRFLVFSDGTDNELAPLLTISNVKRVFFGNAFADMYAISKCKFTIASDSTFSAWGAFLGQKPIIFSRRHFPPVYRGDIPESVLGQSTEIPNKFKILLNYET